MATNTLYENLIKGLCTDGKNQLESVLKNSALKHNGIKVGLHHEELSYDMGSFNCLTLEAKIAPVPENADKEFFKEILEANFIWLSTGGATLWIAPDEEIIQLGIRLAIDQISTHDLIITLDGFTEAVGKLRSTFKELAAKKGAKD